jgi:hypothetical protein
MGRIVPQAIANKPTLQAGNDLYLQAFYDLDSERQIGMSVGRIPWSAIEHYATLIELDYHQRYSLHRLIVSMDRAHLNRIAEKMKPKGK